MTNIGIISFHKLKHIYTQIHICKKLACIRKLMVVTWHFKKINQSGILACRKLVKLTKWCHSWKWFHWTNLAEEWFQTSNPSRYQVCCVCEKRSGTSRVSCSFLALCNSATKGKAGSLRVGCEHQASKTKEKMRNEKWITAEDNKASRFLDRWN